MMCTEEVRKAIEKHMTWLGDPAIQKAGSRQLKGVAKPVELCAAVPSHLSIRLQMSKAKEALQKTQSGLGGGHFHHQSFVGLGKALGMRMKRAFGTVCCVRPDCPADPALDNPSSVLDRQCDLIRMAATEIAATEGQLEFTTGDSLLVCWNTHRACMAHVQQALRFAGLLHSRRNPIAEELGFGAAFGVSPPPRSLDPSGGNPSDPGGRTLFGISSGKLLQGTVGTARQRWRAIIGYRLCIAVNLADACPSLGCLALVASRRVPEWHRDHPNESECGILSHLRPVDVWQVGEARDVLVEQADLVTLARAEREFGVWEFLSDAAAAGMGGGEAVAVSERKQRVKSRKSIAVPEYNDNFFPALRGNRKALEMLQSLVNNGSAGGDQVVMQICKNIEDHIESRNFDQDGPRWVLPALVSFNCEGRAALDGDKGPVENPRAPPAAKPLKDLQLGD